jgi:hypothetical protein
MRNLERRLSKLEGILTDNHGLILYSEKWLAYWGNWMDRCMTEPDFAPNEKIPLEAVDALMESAPDSE